MGNIDIPTGRGIILTGNRKLAAEYVEIGRKRLRDLKQMMHIAGLKMGQKLYAFADCITMRVLSIDGNDFIRIHACAGERCSMDFTAEPLVINAFEVVTFDIKTKGDEINRSQVLPDNGEVMGTFVTYKDAGVYSPTVRAWERDGTTETNFTPTLVSYYKDPGWYKSYADAQAAFDSASWVAVTSVSQVNPGFQFPDGQGGTRFAPVMTQYIAHYQVVDGTEYWRVKAVKEIFTVPYSTIVSESDHFSTLNVRLGNLDVVRGNGVDSGPAVQLDSVELGHHIFHGASTHETGTSQFTVDTTVASIDRIDRELEIVDMDNYAQLINPKLVDFVASGWHLSFEEGLNKAPNRRTSVFPIKDCRKVKTREDYITIT